MRDTLDGQGLAGRIRAAYRRLAETLARGIARLRSGYRPDRLAVSRRFRRERESVPSGKGGGL